MAFRLTKVSAIILHTGRGAVRRLEGEGLGRRVRREEALDELGAAVELRAARHEHGNQPLVEGAPLRQALDEPHEARRLLLLGQPHDAREEVALLGRPVLRPHLEVAPQRRQQHADVRVLLERAEQRRVRLGQRQREPRLVDAPELLAGEEAVRPAAREDAEVEVDHREAAQPPPEVRPDGLRVPVDAEHEVRLRVAALVQRVEPLDGLVPKFAVRARAVEGAPARQLDLDERLAVARLLVVLRRAADDVHDDVLLQLEAADQRLRVDAVAGEGEGVVFEGYHEEAHRCYVPSRRPTVPLPGTEGLGSQCSYAAAAARRRRARARAFASRQ